MRIGIAVGSEAAGELTSRIEFGVSAVPTYPRHPHDLAVAGDEDAVARQIGAFAEAALAREGG